MRLQIVVTAFLSLLLMGCGYTFQGSGSSLPPDVTKIVIPRVENTTSESGLSLIVTEALRDEFDRYGAVTVVEKVAEADAILKARILNIRRNTDTVTSNTDIALELQTQMTLEADLRRTSGPLLWRNPRLTVSKTFGAESDVVVASSADFSTGGLDSGDLAALDDREISRSQERDALLDLSEKIARNIYQDAVAPEF